jgi:hypothetical protein
MNLIILQIYEIKYRRTVLTLVYNSPLLDIAEADVGQELNVFDLDETL